jgi:serine/threonine-protein kinase
MIERLDRHPNTIHGYRVIEPLGEGAASRLFVVSDPKTRELLALKHVTAPGVGDRKFLAQAEREHAVCSQVTSSTVRRSRRIVRYRELLRTTEVAVILDFVDGEPLDQVGRLMLSDLLGVFADTAAGLAHLHDLGWAHADLKPGNILRTGRGRATIIDLGQACRLGERKTRIQGTPGFLAPEQLERGAIDARTDAFLLGATIYRQLTGRYAAAGLSSPGSDRPSLGRLVASAPSSLVNLVDSCLDPRPHARPGDLARVAVTLRRMASDLIEAGTQRDNMSALQVPA